LDFYEVADAQVIHVNMPDHVIGSPYRYEPSLLQRIEQFAKAVLQIVKSAIHSSGRNLTLGTLFQALSGSAGVSNVR
jgi:hypothetical protein